jgi:2-polyprenyl-3-methyl-5-hydroxy-6-metoxy-1,4-benzoquinol methylase
MGKRRSKYRKTVESFTEFKICDVACGSGHILLSAARRLSLAVAYGGQMKTTESAGYAQSMKM